MYSNYTHSAPRVSTWKSSFSKEYSESQNNEETLLCFPEKGAACSSIYFTQAVSVEWAKNIGLEGVTLSISWVTALFDENYLATAQAINRTNSLAELFFLADFADGRLSSSTKKNQQIKNGKSFSCYYNFSKCFFFLFLLFFVMA